MIPAAADTLPSYILKTQFYADRMDPDQTPGLAPVCLRCGRCCRYGPSINANTDDLTRWIQEGRSDILKFFEAYLADGTYVNGIELLPIQPTPTVLWTDMINPETGDYYHDCPFLRPLSENTYYCLIHETRPAICVRFRPWEWGDKGRFFACPIVDEIHKNVGSDR